MFSMSCIYVHGHEMNIVRLPADSEPPKLPVMHKGPSTPSEKKVRHVAHVKTNAPHSRGCRWRSL
jgi:hypothetical protein